MNINLNEIAKNPYSGTFLNNIGLNNPIVIITIIIVIVVYILIFGSLGGSNSESSENNENVKVVEIVLWSIFLLLILFNGYNYIFNMDIVTNIKNFFSDEPTIDIIVKDPPISNKNKQDENIDEIQKEKEVFNIPENNYTYDNAKAICKAYDSELASWKNIKDSFEKGADWCNYGWSKDQMIFFPTQYNKWLQLQKIKGHENDCGRPGINGGYISNPNAKFGVNCYGYKPEISEKDRLHMMNKSIYPITKKDIELREYINIWKSKIKNVMLSPFNNYLWSVNS